MRKLGLRDRSLGKRMMMMMIMTIMMMIKREFFTVSVEIGKVSYFYQFNECDLDGQTD